MACVHALGDVCMSVDDHQLHGEEGMIVQQHWITKALTTISRALVVYKYIFFLQLCLKYYPWALEPCCWCLFWLPKVGGGAYFVKEEGFLGVGTY